MRENLVLELGETLESAEEALRTCYQVCDYPANGQSDQDFALAKVRIALAKLKSLRHTGNEVSK